MAKFLNTTAISYHLEALIKGTKEKLILISPYLQLSERIREHINYLNIQKRDIRIVFREHKLQIEESNWLGNQFSVRTSLCKNLHAKCYLNESEAIITSMNLYEFSQQNNNEMGIYITKADDPELYNSTLDEVQRLLTISEEIRVTVKMVNTDTSSKNVTNKVEIKSIIAKPISRQSGYCIRTGVAIPFDVEKPFCNEAYKSWSKFGDANYQEKFCHFSGNPSHGETCFNRPILKQNWKKAKEIHGL